MRRFPLLALFSVIVALLLLPDLLPRAGDAIGQIAGQPTVAAPPSPTEGPMRIRVEEVVGGLEIPWSLAFAPDGRLFVTERTGRIRLVEQGALRPDPVATLQVAVTSGGETGLMGLALDPAFARNGYIYVMYTYRNAKGQLRNRISRLTFDGVEAGDEMVLLDDIPGETIHDGGRLKFGPDGKLYATAGDASEPGNGQNQGTPAGKVLRINPDGSIPQDNPFPDSPIYTLGHRNPQGLAFQPGTGQLFSTEHGPGANDELNVLEPGRNYGWPDVQGVAKSDKYADPIQFYSPTVAPSGATFYDGSRLRDWKGSLFFVTLKGQALHRLVLGGIDSREVISEEVLFRDEFGRLRDVAEGPDGYLYLATNNRDGRGGKPSPDNDRIVRVVPDQ